MPAKRMKRMEMAAQKSLTVICKASIQCSNVEMIDTTRKSQHKFVHSVLCVNAAAIIGKPFEKNEIIKMFTVFWKRKFIHNNTFGNEQ